MSANVVTRKRPGHTRGETAPARRPVGSWPWVMSTAVGLAVILTSVNLNGVLLGYSWLPAVIFAVGSVLVGTAAARVLRAPTALVPLAGVLGLIFALTVRFFPAESLLGFIPTRATIEAVPALLRQANDVVISQVAPVQPVDGLVLVTCIGLGMVALLVDTLASSVRMPATSGLGLLAVLVAPAVVKPSSISAAGFAAAIIGFLLVLGAAHWLFSRSDQEPGAVLSGSQLNRALAIGSAGIAAALIVPLAIPGFTSGIFPEGSRMSLGTASGLNPMITLGNDLRNPGAVGRMTYVTTSQDPVYLRAVTLENFDGDRWEPNARTDSRKNSVQWMGSATLDPIESVGQVSTTIIDTGQFVSPWLPAPYAPIEVTGLNGSWSFDPLTLSIMGERGSTTTDQEYKVRSITPELTRASLAAANQAPSEVLDPRFLDLPEQMPEQIAQTADDITANTNNRYRKAMAIQQYLRSGDFVYSETAPVEGGYDGSSMDVVARFLEEQSGYCVHYSAAMAVMARSEGIPSRIAVGYAPGTSTGESVSLATTLEGGITELPQFAVDSNDAHAWPELYFEGLGWVPFEPTPSRGVVPEYAMAETAPNSADQAPDNLNPEALTDQDLDIAEDPEAADEPVRGGGAGSESNDARLVGAGLLLIAVAALLAAPFLLRSRVIRRRRRALTAGRLDADELSILAWREVNDAATDHGIPAHDSETPRSFSVRLARERLLGAEPAAALRRLVSGYERAQYGRPGSIGAADHPSAAASTPELASEPVPAPGDSGMRTVLRTRAAATESASTPRSPAGSAQQAGKDVETVHRALTHNSSRRQLLLARWLPASLWRQNR